MADPMAVETKATVAQAELDLVFGSPGSKEGVQEDRPPKWTKQEGGKGAQQAWGGWGNRSKRQWEPTTQSSEGVPDKQTQALLQVATRLILRHESELARLRADTSFVLFIDTGSHSCLQMLRDAGSRWSDLYAKGQVTMPLSTMLMMGLVQSLKQTIDEVRRSEERLARCKDAGWILEGSLPINPNWVYFGWDPKQKQQVVRDGCGLHLRHPDDAGLHGIPSEEGWCSSELQERQAAGGAGECGSGAVCSDNQPPNSSSGRDAPHFLPPIWQCLLQTARLPSAPGKDRQAASGKTARDEVPGDGVLRLEVERQLAGPGGDLGRSSAPAVPRAAQQWACRSLSIPMAKLLNPRGQNLCYANSCLQAWYWLSQMVDSSEHIGGRIQAGLRTIGRSGSRHLPSCMVFQPLFSCWQHVHQQHDAGEFWLHLVNVARSPAFDGFWQARLTNPPSLVDSGTLFHPLILQPGSSLQSMIDDWHQQFAVHGLKESVSALCVQFARYSRDGQKNQCCIDIQPGASVGMPVFCASGDVGVDTRRIAYRVVFIVFHLGLTVHSGHYQTALCVPTARDSGESAWGFKICNDNRQPRAASPRDLRTLAANSYLIGLLRE